ncbi:class I SAM-dependent methyltransferase [Macrococcus carouselicus]|uniref:Methyltransferase domain-containing protein n=1 Tax=Macrococcus carouselicus TaxID=69969 RepID=A0A9Q8CPY2_9STAP|nr:class I SAM-dependent methyltransferase [Macrococcus carouselicus]TDM04584.1 methyltransferase domain-containing protein [Macrococcus carouselicus]
MKLKGILPFSKHLIDEFVAPGDHVVDATCGNGNDTLYLAEKVTDAGHVFAFDIQETAIQHAKVKTAAHSNITYIHDGHQNAAQYLSEAISCAIFNLGYLPRGDKSIVTLPETTIQAINELFDLLKAGGVIILVIYPGHAEGQIEKEAVLKFLQHYDQDKAHILKYEFINQRNNPPFICAIEKR